MPATQSIDRLQQRIYHRTDLDILQEHADTISDLLERGQQLRTDQALEGFVSSHLSQELRRRERGERGPLCSCHLPTCPIKRGLAPPPIRIRGSGTLRAIDTRRSAAEWLLDHPGDAAALKEALDDYDAELGRLHSEWLLLYQQCNQKKWGRRVNAGPGEENER